jgi:hypothetical protein
MKKYILLILLSTISCKAQLQILDISNFGEEQSLTADLSGRYYKDLYNQLNVYEGTYLYSNGNTSLKIVLQKKTMSSVNNRYYEDLIIGEYQYIKDGVEIINTLPKLNQVYSNQSLHSISGNQILTGTEMGCFDCSPTEKRLVGGLVEPERGWATISFRKTTVNGQDALKVFFYWHYGTHVKGTPEPPNPSTPGGEYIMIKQP